MLRKKSRLRAFFRFIFYTFLIFFSISLSFGIYYISKALQDVPDIRQIEFWTPKQVIQVFDVKGRLITEFFIQRRKYVPISKIPKHVRYAFIAIEDKTFYSNPGIDIEGIIRAAIKNLTTGKIVAGGSTISQQLVKNLFLSPKKSFERKIKEVYLALKLNKIYSKDKILEMYLNQIYLGHGAYGVEAASQVYFGKHVWQLNVCEAATIAGLPKAPSLYDPYKNRKKAIERRNLVIQRMLEDGYIDFATAEKCIKSPIVLKGKGNEFELYQDYFTEMVRRWFIDTFSIDAFYKGGYKIYTTIDLDIQKKINKLAQIHLDNLQKTVGFPELTGAEKAKLMKIYKAEAIPIEELGKLQEGNIYVAIIENVDYKNHKIDFKIHDYTGSVVFNGNLGKAKKDLPMYVEYLGDNKYRFVPYLEVALVTIDHKTGAVKAVVGGYSFKKSKFNRVVQGRRQPGSAFKPIVYATAIAKGYTQISIIYDEPIRYWDWATGRFWAPRNYDKKYRGKVMVRYALSHSLNAAAVNLYHRVGKRNVVRMAKKLGITQTKLYPVESLALGSIDIKPIELATVYSTLANQGKRCKPFFIKKVVDFMGDVAYEHVDECVQVYPQPEDAVMVDLLKGVVQEGTGRKALVLGFPVAGKTGTTNDYSDAWFAGFSTKYTTVVWVGYDRKKTIGSKMTGSRAALPLWIQVMALLHPNKNKVKDFPIPEGAAYYLINLTYRVLATPACPFNNKNLVFVKGTQPDLTCNEIRPSRRVKPKSPETLEKEIEQFEMENENNANKTGVSSQHKSISPQPKKETNPVNKSIEIQNKNSKLKSNNSIKVIPDDKKSDIKIIE